MGARIFLKGSLNFSIFGTHVRRLAQPMSLRKRARKGAWRDHGCWDCPQVRQGYATGAKTLTKTHFLVDARLFIMLRCANTQPFSCNDLGPFRSAQFGVGRRVFPRCVPICSDFFRFLPICAPCFREYPDLFRFLPICFQNKSEQIRGTPLCRPLLQIPDLFRQIFRQF